MLQTQETIYQQWLNLRHQQARIRLFDAAQSLGLSEEQLVAANCGIEAQKLAPDFTLLFKNLESLGPLLALTRNPHAVIEKEGVYRNVQLHGKVGMVLDEDIDLRLFFAHWSSLYAVKLETALGQRHGFYIFDHDGSATHKIYLTEQANFTKYCELVERLQGQGLKQTDQLVPATVPASSFDRAKTADFLEDWSKMRDTHDFLLLLKKYGISRYEALQVAEGRYAESLDPQLCFKILRQAAEAKVPIMIFVGNRGCIEIHSGPIEKCVNKGGWFNILDQDFNLHVNTRGLSVAYRVEKPTTDGVVTSIELFAEDGELVMQVFGQRKPGQAELESWREILRQDI
ncbi:MAG: hemin-degrading factor [Oligoflexus sp.]